MSGAGHYEFNANKIFLWLIILTAAEVAWGILGHELGWGRLLLWGGLSAFAFFKGLYIAVYFMHLRFEGWIVKGLILPTPFLIAVILFAISPDVSRNDELLHPVGAMYDPSTGVVQDYMQHTSERPGPGHTGEGHGPAASSSTTAKPAH